jgi:hypothetical protein
LDERSEDCPAIEQQLKPSQKSYNQESQKHKEEPSAEVSFHIGFYRSFHLRGRDPGNYIELSAAPSKIMRL